MVVIVCLTAGICEEALYGGSCCTIFNFLPFHLSLTRARVLPSVIFGIEHCYQGVVIKAWLSRRGRRGADDADRTFTCDDVAGHGKSAAADGGACNVERA
jgi:hypothetical protein